MNPTELSTLLGTAGPPMLLHVLPEEVFTACRIPGSVNACVYETAFLERVSAIAADRDAGIVVYGAGEGSLDVEEASEKLRAAGYGNVLVLDDGLAGWRAAGLPVEGVGRFPSPAVLHGIYQADVAASVIRWTGRNLVNQHYGKIRLASGEVEIEEGRLVAARFVIDMNSITCDDLTDASWNAMLIGHLKTPDFFDVESFPTAGFVATRAEPVRGATEGRCNYELHGEFTLRGITRPLVLPVVIASSDGKQLTGQGQFEIDRTEFGSRYGSGRFFRFLGKHVVNDLMHLDVMIHAGFTPRQ